MLTEMALTVPPRITVSSITATPGRRIERVLFCRVGSGPTRRTVRPPGFGYPWFGRCFFFALYDRRLDLAGSTIHFVDTGIDTGDLIEHVSADARPGETAEELYCRAERRAIHRLGDLLGDLELGRLLPRRPQPLGGWTFKVRDRKPHHDLIEWIRRRLLGAF